MHVCALEVRGWHLCLSWWPFTLLTEARSLTELSLSCWPVWLPSFSWNPCLHLPNTDWLYFTCILDIPALVFILHSVTLPTELSPQLLVNLWQLDKHQRIVSPHCAWWWNPSTFWTRKPSSSLLRAWVVSVAWVKGKVSSFPTTTQWPHHHPHNDLEWRESFVVCVYWSTGLLLSQHVGGFSHNPFEYPDIS